MTLQSPGTSHVGDPQLTAEINALAPWFHNLHLPDGTQTASDHPLGDFPAFKWTELAPHLPDDLTGRRVLDIGANAGFYSFSLAARGAEVLALDLDPHYLAQARWAAPRLDPHGRVQFRQGSLYDLATEAAHYDLILFMGVLYHLRYPLLALDLIASRLADGGQLVLQTLTMPDDPGGETLSVPEDLDLDERATLTAAGWPRAAFIEHRLADDPTNWWAPNDACVLAMIRSAGLELIARPGHEVYLCRADPGAARRGVDVSELAAVLGAAQAGASVSQRK